MKTILSILICASVAAAQPHIVNGKVATGQGTVAAFAANQTEPAWIGYAVPAVRGVGRSCCWYNTDSSSYNGCLLEPRDLPKDQMPVSKVGPLALESPKEVYVLFRVENKRLMRVRTFAPDCELDAGGLTLTWLPGVNAGESVRALEALLHDTSLDTARERERLRAGALEAIALTADPAAQALLEKMAADPNEAMRRRALAGLSRRPESMPFLSNLARTDKNPRTRGEVLVVLADFAGVKAIPLIQSALASDTDREVQQQAVRALGRLPREEGVPLLIQTAKSQTNPEARKEAIRQLGRIKDARATAFFEDVLK